MTSLSYDNVLRASGVDGVMARPFYSTALFRSVPLLLEFSWDGASRKAAWLADRAYGVVATRMGMTVRVLAADFEDLSRSSCSHRTTARFW